MTSCEVVNQGLQDYIFTSKYARWIPELKRRETWDEAVDRVSSMHLEKYAYLGDEDKDEIRWAFDLVKQRRVLPSMRSMQFGGKAMLAHEARGYNCLGIETEFITNHGVKSFKNFKDGDSTLVLTHNGTWKNAIVRNYGKQILYPITISRVKSDHTVWATEDHTWMLKSGQTTQSIQEGDLLRGAENIFSSFNYDDSDIDERLYWAYGYVYGDGTKAKNSAGAYTKSMVRLCGEDKYKYLYRFLELGFSSSEPLSCKGDSMVYTGSYLKTAPDPTVDAPRLIRAFVRGYLDADGAKTHTGRVSQNIFYSIQSSDMDHIKFIRECFPIAGVYLISERELTGQVTNYGIRPYTISFNIFNAPNNQENSNTPFRVKSIDYTTFRQEDVWCLEVEDDHTFVLKNGLVTGNCSVRHLDSIRAFAEIGYLMLCGCGTGIGISKHFLGRLSSLVSASDKTGSVITYVITDTIEGWADSLEVLLSSYFTNNAMSGRKIVFDYSKIRRKGALLKTGGGRAPGYKPLKAAHTRIKKLLDRIIEEENVTTLRPIHAYDILMHFADAVLSGGIRRTASSVIFDKDDEEMMTAKTFFKVDKFRDAFDAETNSHHCRVWVNKRPYDVDLDMNDSFEKFTYESLIENKTIGWRYIEPQRGRSNNSVLLLRDETTEEDFKKIVEWTKQFGEPAFVFANHSWTLFNPCFEIGFIPVTDDGECGVQFCNLSTINGNLVTSIEDFLECVRAQTIIGTLQAGYTHFPYLSKVAKTLTEEEALLGNSMTGILSKPDILLDEKVLQSGAELSIKVNTVWAKKLYINPAARVTAIKPEGTGSLAIGVQEPGAHAAHGHHFFKRIQATQGDPVYEFFKEKNAHMCELSKWSVNHTDDVITFPIKAKDGALVKDDLSAIKHLDIIRSLQKNWVEAGKVSREKDVSHNVSCTVIVKDDEWGEVISYLYNNKDYFSAVSLLAYSGDKDYPQAPFEKVVSKDDFEKFSALLDNYVPMDYTGLYESQDETHLVAESSCSGGACLI